MEGYGVVGEEVAGSRERVERREVGDREERRKRGRGVGKKEDRGRGVRLVQDATKRRDEKGEGEKPT